MVLGGNRYDPSELAGAFGDLGTLIPFVVGYITINRLDAQGVLLGFGAAASGADGRPGTVWVFNRLGRLNPIPIVLGVTDGSFTVHTNSDGYELIAKALLEVLKKDNKMNDYLSIRGLPPSPASSFGSTARER